MELQQLRQLEEHLEGCPACRAEAESYRKLPSLLGGDPAPEVSLPSGSEAAAWILRQDRERSRRWWQRLPGGRVAPGVAGLALVAATVAVVGVSPKGFRSSAARSPVTTPATPLPALVVVDDEETGRQVMLAPSPFAPSAAQDEAVSKRQ